MKTKNFILLFYIFITAILVSSIACSSNNDSDSESGSGSAGEVSFDLSDALALVSPEDGDLQKLTSDGSLAPVITLTNDSGSSTVSASYIVISPVGDFHFMFNNFVTVNDEECRWIVVDTSNSARCVDTSRFDFDLTNLSALVEPKKLAYLKNSGSVSSDDSVEINLFQLEFDQSGNAYYLIYDDTDSLEEIRKWEQSTGTISTLLDAEAIGLGIDEFFLLPDSSFILDAGLQGTGQSIFQFIPSSNGSGSLEEVCIEEIFTSNNGTLYAYALTEDISCSSDSDDDESIFEGILVDGELSLAEVDSGGVEMPSGEFIEDSEGNIYVYDGSTTATLINSSPFEEISFSTVVDEELSEANGDYLFLTGTDSEGNRVFMRKSLLGDREEIDLLGGSNLLVQHFDVASNGDVYFGALDLNTTTVYLYKYNNTTGQLEQLESLFGDLSDILVL